MDISQVTPRIATGAAILASEIPTLAASNVSIVIDTRIEADDSDAYNAANFAYLRFPTNDDGAPKDIHYWATLLNIVVPLVAHPDHRFLFQCVSGINRGPSATFAFMVALGWDPTAAAAAIVAARPAAVVRYQADALAACQSLGYTN